MQTNPSTGGLVYSPYAGRRCTDGRKPVANCICRQAAPSSKAGGGVRVSRESKGRGGKTVTLVRGLALEAAALAQLGKQLRTACGSGGTGEEGVVEVQGDHCDLALQTLPKHGTPAHQ